MHAKMNMYFREIFVLIFIKSLHASEAEMDILNHMCSPQCISSHYSKIFDHPYNAIAAIMEYPEVIVFEEPSNNEPMTLYSVNQFAVHSDIEAVEELLSTAAHIAVIHMTYKNEAYRSNIREHQLNNIQKIHCLLNTTTAEEVAFGTKFAKILIIINSDWEYTRWKSVEYTAKSTRLAREYGDEFDFTIIQAATEQEAVHIINKYESLLHASQLNKVSVQSLGMTPCNSRPETLSRSDDESVEKMTVQNDTEAQTNDVSLIYVPADEEQYVMCFVWCLLRTLLVKKI